MQNTSTISPQSSDAVYARRQAARREHQLWRVQHYGAARVEWEQQMDVRHTVAVDRAVRGFRGQQLRAGVTETTTTRRHCDVCSSSSGVVPLEDANLKLQHGVVLAAWIRNLCSTCVRKFGGQPVAEHAG